MPLVNVNFQNIRAAYAGRDKECATTTAKISPQKGPQKRPIFWFTVILLQEAEEGAGRGQFFTISFPLCRCGSVLSMRERSRGAAEIPMPGICQQVLGTLLYSR